MLMFALPSGNPIVRPARHSNVRRRLRLFLSVHSFSFLSWPIAPKPQWMNVEEEERREEYDFLLYLTLWCSGSSSWIESKSPVVATVAAAAIYMYTVARIRGGYGPRPEVYALPVSCKLWGGKRGSGFI